ncbi:uncharacterized protein BJ212DRAFT_1488282 [Suillus subaureus]|uniref:Uncharacterized protein n=1 Tax=Suillus subaureus TaxID=48587 RepID=A0A9P7DP78_9AGAM|nr:uncharacterized protein BJ212DRAFT_1488282 [Suillus subaureus]KAG1799577.1 hypothetical protein BJ212DRAFT_1488282 [Suillus subaureus]
MHSFIRIAPTTPRAPSEEILDEGRNVILARAQASKSTFTTSATTPVLLENQRTLLEESVHDVAVEHLRRESRLDKRSLCNRELRREDLQKWVLDWHQKLKARIEAVIKDIIAVEGKIGKHICAR